MMRMISSGVVVVCAMGAAATAQEGGGSSVSYGDAVTCAGKFRWVLDASSGGQPALNEYSLDERVKGVEVFTAQAMVAATQTDPAPDVARDIQAMADETIGVFFDDPDSVEADLMACAVEIGMREE